MQRTLNAPCIIRAREEELERKRRGIERLALGREDRNKNTSKRKFQAARGQRRRKDCDERAAEKPPKAELHEVKSVAGWNPKYAAGRAMFRQIRSGGLEMQRSGRDSKADAAMTFFAFVETIQGDTIKCRKI